MQVRLKQAAFLEGRRYPPGAVIEDYQGPSAAWIEVLDLRKAEAKATPRRRSARRDAG